MAKEWQKVKRELTKATEDIFITCPDEIKRFNYGIMTHSDAGKNALNQYFGHWVHGYAGYMIYSSDTIDAIRQLARRPTFSLVQAKEMFAYMTKPPDREYTIAMIVKYAGQVSLGKYVDKTLAAMDSVRVHRPSSPAVLVETFAHPAD